MKAYVTSIGEPTTDLCIWSLERNGFDVHLSKDPNTSLAEKLKFIYSTADEDFVRVDADIIVNRNCTLDMLRAHQDRNIWWMQFTTFDWFQQDISWGGVQFIKKRAIPHLYNNIEKFMDSERPESQMYRLDEFDNPRRCKGIDICMGINSYGIKDIERVIDTKTRRKQIDNYDFELAEKLSRL